MRSPNYDAWLEAPYQRAADEQAVIESAADRYGLDAERDYDEIVERLEVEREMALENLAELEHEAREWA